MTTPTLLLDDRKNRHQPKKELTGINEIKFTELKRGEGLWEAAGPQPGIGSACRGGEMSEVLGIR